MDNSNLHWLAEYEQYLWSTGKKANSINTYAQAMRSFSRWYEDSTGEVFSPSSITPIDIAEYKRWLMNTKKPATINKAMAALRIFCKWAVSEGYCQPGVGGDIKNLPLARRGAKWLTRKEQLQLIRAVQKSGNARDIALIIVMLHGGLRVSEVVHLRKDDVILSQRKAKVVVRYGKGNKWREVPLNNDARKALLQYQPSSQGESPWFFCSSRSGKPLTTRAVQMAVSKYARHVGLEVTPHRLRHTFCHNLVAAGVSLDVVAMLAGHITATGQPNIKTTVIYTTPGEQDLRFAVERLSWE